MTCHAAVTLSAGHQRPCSRACGWALRVGRLCSVDCCSGASGDACIAVATLQANRTPAASQRQTMPGDGRSLQQSQDRQP